MSDESDSGVDIQGIFEREGLKAVLVDVGGNAVWIPKSVVLEWGEDYKTWVEGQEIEIVVETWFAEREGIA